MKFNIPSCLLGIVIGLLAGYILMISAPIKDSGQLWKEATDSLQTAIPQEGVSFIVWPNGDVTLVKQIKTDSI